MRERLMCESDNERENLEWGKIVGKCKMNNQENREFFARFRKNNKETERSRKDCFMF